MNDIPPRSSFGQFMAEMRRRHVVRFALAYAAAAFVLLQLGEIVLPAFGFGEAGLRILVVLTALGFPPALVLAWVYDITTEGIKKTEGDDAVGESPSRLAIGSLLVTTVVVTGTVGAYLARQGVFETMGAEAAPPATEVVQPASYDPSEPIQSLAVLPLDDNSPNMDQAYLTAGMHEELIAKLSMLDGVRVVSRTTSLQYQGSELTSPEIGQELGVDVLIEGSIARSGERILVTLQLIHAPSDSHIETMQWDTLGVDDHLTFQSEVALDVVDVINPQNQLETFAQTAALDVDPAARDYFLRGQYEYERGTADGYRRALENFQAAADVDPDFAAALTGLASTRIIVGIEGEGLTEGEIEQAHSEAVAALQLDSNSAEAHEVLAIIERNLGNMDDGFRIDAPLSESQVITVPGAFDPVDFGDMGPDSSWVFTSTRLATALGERISRRMSAFADGDVRRDMGDATRLMHQARYIDAAEVLESIVEEAPELVQAWDMLARSHIHRGQPSQAAVVINRWSSSGAENAPSSVLAFDLEHSVEVDGAHGYWSWKLDRLDEMNVSEGRRVPDMEYATAYAGAGNKSLALSHLRSAVDNRERAVISVANDPVWDDFRGDPEFEEVVRSALDRARDRFPPRRGGGGGRQGR